MGTFDDLKTKSESEVKSHRGWIIAVGVAFILGIILAKIF